MKISRFIIIAIICLVSLPVLLILAFSLFFLYVEIRTPEVEPESAPIATYYIEELKLYFLAEENVRPDVQTIYFSQEQKNLRRRESGNYIRYRYTRNALEQSRNTRKAVLYFCQIDSTGLCAIGDTVEFCSLDYPIVVLDKNGCFTWKGEKHRLMDLPFITVYHTDRSLHKPEQWDALARQ